MRLRRNILAAKPPCLPPGGEDVKTGSSEPVLTDEGWRYLTCRRMSVQNKKNIRFLPAFLISHGKWFRSAISHDSFPPGEALGCSRTSA